jgi:hypothetical protein
MHATQYLSIHFYFDEIQHENAGLVEGEEVRSHAVKAREVRGLELLRTREGQSVQHLARVRLGLPQALACGAVRRKDIPESDEVTRVIMPN